MLKHDKVAKDNQKFKELALERNQLSEQIGSKNEMPDTFTFNNSKFE